MFLLMRLFSSVWSQDSCITVIQEHCITFWLSPKKKKKSKWILNKKLKPAYHEKYICFIACINGIKKKKKMMSLTHWHGTMSTKKNKQQKKNHGKLTENKLCFMLFCTVAIKKMRRKHLMLVIHFFKWEHWSISRQQ